jgi:hypothetical protein
MEFKSGEYFQQEFLEGELDLALLKNQTYCFLISLEEKTSKTEFC